MLIKTKSKTYDVKKQTLVMGILNITPDSFSDGGSYNSIEKAMKQAKAMEQAGAHIIDIGGESARPDHAPISIEEEVNRVIPVIEALKDEINIPISIDTYKATTAKKAIEAGAEMINDIWGAKKDPEMATVAAEYEVPIILMHNRSNKNYHSLIDDMISDLQESIDIAKSAGVKDENIIIDPGIGFAKEVNDNYLVLNRLDEFVKRLPYPILLGTSRKSFINHVLPIPPAERDNATGVTTCYGMTKGIHIVRVHDVKRNVELIKMMDAIHKGVGTFG